MALVLESKYGALLGEFGFAGSTIPRWMIEIVADFLPAQRSLEPFPPGKCWSFPNTMPISFVDVRIGAALLVATRQKYGQRHCQPALTGIADKADYRGR